MDKFDEIYLQDPNTSAHIVFEEFYSYKRDIGLNIHTFWCVTNFSIRNYKNLVCLFPMECRLFVLNAVNLSEENEKYTGLQK